MPPSFSVLIFTKFKSQKPMRKLLKNLAIPISCVGHFLHTLRIVVSRNKRFSVCFFIAYISICMESNQNSSSIFLLEIPFSKQSGDLIG